MPASSQYTQMVPPVIPKGDHYEIAQVDSMSEPHPRDLCGKALAASALAVAGAAAGEAVPGALPGTPHEAVPGAVPGIVARPAGAWLPIEAPDVPEAVAAALAEPAGTVARDARESAGAVPDVPEAVAAALAEPAGTVARDARESAGAVRAVPEAVTGTIAAGTVAGAVVAGTSAATAVGASGNGLAKAIPSGKGQPASGGSKSEMLGPPAELTAGLKGPT